MTGANLAPSMLMKPPTAVSRLIHDRRNCERFIVHLTEFVTETRELLAHALHRVGPLRQHLDHLCTRATE